jgi:hypothetical protein
MQSQDGGALIWNTLNPFQNGPGPNQNLESGPVPQASPAANAGKALVMLLMSPHAGKHSVYFVIYPWSKNLLWILHE